MKIDLSKTKLVTHQQCMDGSGCSIIFQAAGGKKENIIFVSPNYLDTDEVARELLETWEGPILFADVSISEESASLLDGRPEVYLLDHHKSAIPLTRFGWCEIEVENLRCGTRMLLDWCIEHNLNAQHLKQYEVLADFIDDIDRWQHFYSQSEDLAILHGFITQPAFIKRFVKNAEVKFSENERFVIDVEKEKRKSFIASKKDEVFTVKKIIAGKEVNFGFIRVNKHQSDLGAAICTDPMLNIDAAVMIGNHISMRSSGPDGVDVSEIASLNGGGGHKNAAGCRLETVLGKGLVDLIIEKLKVE